MRRAITGSLTALALLTGIVGHALAQVQPPNNVPAGTSPAAVSALAARALKPDGKKGGKGKGPAGIMLPVFISYRAWRGLVVVDALVNGNNPARFAISTGLNMSTVSPTETARLQLTALDTRTHVTDLDVAADGANATLKTLKLGAGVLHDVQVAQVNLLPLLTHGPMLDGPLCWLGTNWLSGYLVTFDFESHSMTLNAPGAHFQEGDSAIVPFKLKDGRPVVKVTVAGAGTFDAVVDTGSVGTLIPASIAFKLKGKKQNKTPSTGMGVAGAGMTRMILPRIAVGKAELKSLMVAYFSDDAPVSANKNMAVIGMDFLRRFRVAISYKRSQMQFMPLQSAIVNPVSPVFPAVRNNAPLPGVNNK